LVTTSLGSDVQRLGEFHDADDVRGKMGHFLFHGSDRLKIDAPGFLSIRPQPLVDQSHTL
jgi:hypothetical protein